MPGEPGGPRRLGLGERRANASRCRRGNPGGADPDRKDRQGGRVVAERPSFDRGSWAGATTSNEIDTPFFFDSRNEFCHNRWTGKGGLDDLPIVEPTDRDPPTHEI